MFGLATKNIQKFELSFLLVALVPLIVCDKFMKDQVYLNTPSFTVRI